jgi:hypothetical protein
MKRKPFLTAAQWFDEEPLPKSVQKIIEKNRKLATKKKRRKK